VRGRRPLLVALLGLAGCAARAARVPAPSLALADDPPPLPAPPRDGPNDSDRLRFVRVAVHVDGRVALRWKGHLRVGVWTTLDRWQAEEFVTRESWGRLGERRPRRLARIEDELLFGASVRVRPEEARDGDAFVSFAAEVASGEVGDARTAGTFHGRDVELPAPRRHGYRLLGRAPAAFVGPVARWNGVVVYLGDDREGRGPPPGSCFFEAPGAAGFVAGTPARVEAFVRPWTPAEPIEVQADGVERADFRLVDRRRAAGFVREGAAFQTYGDVFRCEVR